MRSARYDARAAYYEVETAEVPRPCTLPGLLTGVGTVAEVPCGAGHFLDVYRQRGTRVVLLDAEPAMVRAADTRRSRQGVPGRAEVMRLGRDRPAARYDLVVCPNAAFNHLLDVLGPARTAGALAALVGRNGRLLLHLLLRHDDRTVDAGTCYDPAAAHGVWLTEWTRPDPGGGRLTRHRLQRRQGDRIEVSFRRERDGHELAPATVGLRLVDAPSVRALFRPTGMAVVRTEPGRTQPSELVLHRLTTPDEP